MDKYEGNFDKLLESLEPDLKTAEERYSELHKRLASFFRWKNCEDPENLTDETISRAVKNVEAGQEIRTDKLYSYIFGIANNVFREYLREVKHDQQLINDLPQNIAMPSDQSFGCMQHCLQKLPSDKLKLIELYYLEDEERQELAQMQGIPLSNLRVLVHRIKKELRACYKACREKF